jgi:hypothetical protein
MDDNGHGTHVAGTIAATANNDTGGCNSNTGLGAIGVAPDTKIMALKFLDASGYGYTSDAIAALDYAVANGAQISNHSYGDSVFEQAMLDAISEATNAGHLFVAAAGNGNWFGFGQNNDSRPFYPASYQPAIDAVISVAASTSSDTYPLFSNYGATSVDLAAPGQHIWSTIPYAEDTVDGTLDGYTRKDGTSMATPHVVGAAALVWSLEPSLSALEVKQILLDTVDPISGRDTVTDGRLNAGQAVAAVSPSDQLPTVQVTSPTDGDTVVGAITITASANDDEGVTQVEFFINGTSIAVDANGDDGWSASWNTALYGDGNHSLTAIAADTIGQTASHEITVVVDNIDEPPSVEILSPADGSILSGSVIVTADAADDREVMHIEFFVDDGIPIGIDDEGSDGWSTDWDTTQFSDESHTITAIVTDNAAQTSSDSITVTVNNAPSTSIHVADLDATSTSERNRWTATVTVLVHDNSGNPVADATVEGSWSGGASGDASRTTGVDGTCTVDVSGIRKNIGVVTFTVNNVLADGFEYVAGDNHDEDGDSDGTAIDVNKPLYVAGVRASEDPAGELLTLGMVDTVLDTAIWHWTSTSVVSDRVETLRGVEVEIADLDGGLLGLAYSDWIVLDRDAAGYGWSVGGTNAGTVDLLSTVTHELGHVLGYDHGDEADDLMAATLPLGTRRLNTLVPLATEPLTATLVDKLYDPALAGIVSTEGAADESLLPPPIVTGQPIVTTQPNLIGGTRTRNDFRALEDILDDETELLEEGLIELLARSAR